MQEKKREKQEKEMSRDYSANVGLLELSEQFQSLMVGTQPCECGSEEHQKPPKNAPVFVKKVGKPLLQTELEKLKKLEKLEALAHCPFWYKWMSGGVEPVKLPGRIASTRKEMAELVQMVSEAGKDHLTSCEIYTDSGEEAVFVAHGERKCLVVKGSGAVFAHVRAVCKEASLRINIEQPSFCTLKSAYDLYLMDSKVLSLNFENWVLNLFVV